MAQKKWNIITVILAVLVLLLGVSHVVNHKKAGHHSQAQAQGMNIAYIMADSINKNYYYIEEMQATLKSEAETSEKIMQRNIAKIEKRFQELQKEVNYMTPSQKQEAQKELGQMEQNAQVLRNELANDLAIKEAELQNIFFESINTYLEKYNKTAGYDFILSYNLGGQILNANDALNITEEILDGLNEDYKVNKAAATESNAKK
jgi:outer membrane protein